MAPIRRYLRISRHSALECRIFLENPADGPRWLLRAQDPALPRVFEAVKPYVLPKLREENERMKGKGKKKKSVKDVVKKGKSINNDFEVSVFLTEVRTRHALLVKHKTFAQEEARSTNGHDGGNQAQPMLIREESEGDDFEMHNIPAADGNMNEDDSVAQDDKKKLRFDTTYDGFNIWGFVLCLLVERKGSHGKKLEGSDGGSAQALMEEWISTQQVQDDEP